MTGEITYMRSLYDSSEPAEGLSQFRGAPIDHVVFLSADEGFKASEAYRREYPGVWQALYNIKRGKHSYGILLLIALIMYIV